MFYKDSTATLFSLPRDEHVKDKWLKFIFATIPQQYIPIVLCSHHFNDESFTNINEFNCGFASWLFLKEGSVVPTVYGSASSSKSQPVSIIKGALSDAGSRNLLLTFELLSNKTEAS